MSHELAVQNYSPVSRRTEGVQEIHRTLRRRRRSADFHCSCQRARHRHNRPAEGKLRLQEGWTLRSARGEVKCHHVVKLSVGGHSESRERSGHASITSTTKGNCPSERRRGASGG